MKSGQWSVVSGQRTFSRRVHAARFDPFSRRVHAARGSGFGARDSKDGSGRVLCLQSLIPNPQSLILSPNPQSLIPNPSRSAFTLVEMLVTVTIIGILAAMSFGALQMAREAARETATKL